MAHRGKPLTSSAHTVLWFQMATGVSSLGGRVTEIALPLTALLVLDCSALQVGILSSATLLPNLILGIPAGTWVEGMHPRRLMLLCDAGRAIAIGSIPVAQAFGLLAFPHLLASALVVGALTVFGDIASASYLPRLVGLEALVSARSRQMTLMQLADVAGRPLGGLLVGAFGAARAMAADTLSYVVSLAFVWRLPEMPPTRAPGEGEPFGERLRAGARFAWRNQVNRRIALEAAHYNLFYQALIVVFLVLASSRLGWSGTQIGLALGANSLGAVIGSALAPRLSTRWGIGPVILRALLFADGVTLLIPVVLGSGGISVALMCLIFLIIGAGSLISGVLASSLNRLVTPEEIYSRVIGANRVLTRGGTALGGLLGGLLVEYFDPRPALVICAVGMCSAAAWVASRRITSVHTVADALIDSPLTPPSAPASPSAAAERTGSA